MSSDLRTAWDALLDHIKLPAEQTEKLAGEWAADRSLPTDALSGITTGVRPVHVVDPADSDDVQDLERISFADTEIQVRPFGAPPALAALVVQPEIGVMGWQYTWPKRHRRTHHTPRGARGMVAWGVNEVIPTTEVLIVVEGVSDWISTRHHLRLFHSWTAIGAVGAGLGPKAVKRAALALHKEAGVRPLVVVVMDGDSPGDKAAAKTALAAVAIGCRTTVLRPDDGLDMDKMWADDIAHQILLERIESTAISPPDRLRVTSVSGSAEGAERARDLQKEITEASIEARRPASRRAPSTNSSNNDPYTQADLEAALRSLGARPAKTNSASRGKHESHWSCPPPGCGGGTDRLWVTPSGQLGCRQCPDNGRAVWMACREIIERERGAHNSTARERRP